MNHSRETTRSDPACALARGSPVALTVLLDDADITVAELLAGSTTGAALTADMVARKDDSVQLACGGVGAARAALAHSTKRVAYCARRRARLASKRGDASTELLGATAKQLRVWGSPVVAQECVLEGVAAGCALTAVDPLVQVHDVVTAVLSRISDRLLALCTTGCVVTGDGLRVACATGPGLMSFEPHSRSEFSVVLAHVDASAPVWLQASDVSLNVCTAAITSICTAVPSVTVGGDGSVCFAYGGLPDNALEVVLQLTVCGVSVADGTGDGDWVVCVPRKPLVGHECAAVGVHVRTLAVVKGYKSGMAVSPDEKWLVVGLELGGTLSVYSSPGGELVRTFGGRGDGPLQFNCLRRLCFAPKDCIIAVDYDNKRLQEITLEGVFVRFIGVGEFGGGNPDCVDVHDDVIAVGCDGGGGPRVALLDYDTGAVTSRFGLVGTAPGRLSDYCSGIRFSRDGSLVIVAEDDAKRLSVFTIAGVFVRCVGEGVLGGGALEVLLSASGEYVVADFENNRVCVFSPDGSELVRSWGREGAGDGQLWDPIALGAAGKHLYVVELETEMAQVFE